jgi:hypothetical protein
VKKRYLKRANKKKRNALVDVDELVKRWKGHLNLTNKGT